MAVQSTASAQIRTMADQLLALERRPLDAMQATKTENTQRLDALTGLGSRLADLRRLAQSFASAGSLSPLRAFQVVSGDESVVSVTAAPNASSGTYTVEVQSLAARHSLAGIPVSSDGSTLAPEEGSEPGTFRFEITTPSGSREVSVTVAAGATDGEVLQAVSDAINRARDGWQASVLNVGGGESRLLVQSKESGTGSRIVAIADLEGDLMSRLGLAGSESESSAHPATVREAADAHLVVEGIDVTSSSNTVTDVLPGLTLTLRGTGTQPVSIQVERDSDQILSKVNELLTAYNDTLDEIRTQTQPSDGQGSARGLLAGTTGMTALRSTLRMTMTLPAGGADATFRSLGAIGITADRQGHLSVSDPDALRAAALEDPTALESLFSGESGVATRLQTFLDGYSRTGGIIDQQEAVMRRRIASNDERIQRLQDNLDRREQMLIDQLAKLQSAMGILSQQQRYLGGLISGGAFDVQS